ncbi:caspase family protein [Nocardiopsis sp. B62]|uniref:caspase family protein n=1 Tax=Nocardiopsis sp. B62 TaxID=2824874 RepID=UPI001B37B071|nr:caspase family protein [Nocardiopsis sp. B62]MBQ1083327.1 caspase family protein [Nocardiopsis sp. B62]
MVDGLRRLLVTTVVSRHLHAPEWDRPELVDAQQKIVDLFTGSLGYEHVDVLGNNLTANKLKNRLSTFIRSPERSEDDLIVIYISCHGDLIEDTNDHILLTGDSDPNDLSDPESRIDTADLAKLLLGGTRVRNLLLILDTCHSGQGTRNLIGEVSKRMAPGWGQRIGGGFVLMHSAQPFEEAETGTFPNLLAEAVKDAHSAGHTPEKISLGAVVEHINANKSKPGYQTVGWDPTGLTGEVPPFLTFPFRDTHIIDKLRDSTGMVRTNPEWEHHDLNILPTLQEPEHRTATHKPPSLTGNIHESIESKLNTEEHRKGDINDIRNALINLQISEHEAELNIYRDIVIKFSRDSLIRALRHASKAELITKSGVRSPIWETDLHYRFIVGDPSDELEVHLEEDDGNVLSEHIWDPSTPPGDFYQILVLAVRNAGGDLGVGLNDPTRSTQDLSEMLIEVTKYRSQELLGHRHYLRRIIERKDGWYFTEDYVLPADKLWYRIDVYRLGEVDWEEHLNKKGWPATWNIPFARTLYGIKPRYQQE